MLLVAWDGLSPAAAARVAGCSLSAFHVRLFRARRRLRDATDDPDDRRRRGYQRGRLHRLRPRRAGRGALRILLPPAPS